MVSSRTRRITYRYASRIYFQLFGAKSLEEAAARLKTQYPECKLPFQNPRIIIDKSERIARLYDNKKLVKEYTFVMGQNTVGTKTKKGDSRTPEGTYYICTRLTQSRWHLFMGINYPNQQDAQNGLEEKLINQAEYEQFKKAADNKKCPDWWTPLGGAIGLHGGGARYDWTAGCIAFKNKDIEELFLATRYWTPVIIEP